MEKKSINISQKSNRKQFTLRFTLTTAFCGLTLLGGVFLSTVTAMKVGEFIREELRIRLADVISIMASQIDGDLHHKVQTTADEKSESYHKLRAQIREMQDGGTHIAYAYTMRHSPNGQAAFIVDATEDGKDFSHVGDIYKNTTVTLAAALDAGPEVTTPFVEPDLHVDDWGTFLSAYAPIYTADGKKDGIVGVDVSAENVVEHEWQYKIIVWIVSGVVVLIVLPLGLSVASRIRQPLIQLADEMEKVQQFELDGEVRIHSRILEIDRMVNQLENMKRGLRSFRKYVPADLVRDLIELGVDAKLGGTRKELTIFFSDIANFTAQSEKMPPEKLVGFLGEYLNAMNAVLLRNNATVDKYIGDGVMAFWGAPHPLTEHALHACRAALECQKQIQQLNLKWKSEGHSIDFSTRMGIHSGDVIVGNMGSDERMSYTVIGDNVNLSSRLEGVNKHYGTSILITGATYYDVKEHFVTRLVDKVVMMGKTIPTNIYELVGLVGEVPAEKLQVIEQYHAAFKLYSEREFAEAMKLFTQIKIMDNHDHVSALMMARCKLYLDQPPAEDWQGEFVLDSK